MRSLIVRLEGVAQRDGHVLLHGERGVGKKLLARWLHVLGKRRAGPLVMVRGGHCAVGLIESTLLGHANGTRMAGSQTTGEPAPNCLELASGGTLVLDGLGGLDADQQIRLAEVLQTGRIPTADGRARSIDARVIATTHINPALCIADGRLQPALLQALSSDRIDVAPLRERPQDIPPLAMTFLSEQSGRYAKDIDAFESDAMGAMLKHGWPGNVRELQNAVERGVLTAVGDGEGLRLSDIGLPQNGEGQFAFDEMKLNDVERVLIQKSLVHHSGNVSRAARSLGLSRSALYRRLHRHNL